MGTPSKNDGSADLQYVHQVARDIAKNMKGYKVIVNKSTFPVGTEKFVVFIDIETAEIIKYAFLAVKIF